MIKHDDVWQAIDTIARQRHESLRKLASDANLDPTVFNPSKREDRATGKPRWPSLPTLIKLIHAARLTMARFGALVDKAARSHGR